MIKRLWISILGAGVMLCAAGCGYTVGYVSHPQLKSVAVAPVINETTSYNASAMLRNFLAERFMVDGSLKLEGQKAADCIVYTRVLDVKYRAIGITSLTSDDDFMPEEWRVTVTVEYSVILPGRAKPLIPANKVTGMAEFLVEPDLENARANGLRQALNNAAKSIVAGLTEAW